MSQSNLSPVSDKLNIILFTLLMANKFDKFDLIIIELLRVKFNYMQLSLFNRAEVDFYVVLFVHALVFRRLRSMLSYFCTSMYDFIINIYRPTTLQSASRLDSKTFLTKFI